MPTTPVRISHWMELRIERTDQALRATAMGSHGERTSPQALPPEWYINALTVLARAIVQTQRGAPLDPTIIAKTRALYEGFFLGAIRDMLMRLSEASGDEPLLLKLTLDDPTLQAIPWEALLDPTVIPGIVGIDRSLIIARGVRAHIPSQLRRIDDAVRVLVIAPSSSARRLTFQVLDPDNRLLWLVIVGSRWPVVIDGIDPMGQGRADAILRIEDLRRRRPPHVLHFITKGRVNTQGNPELHLAGEGGEETWITAQELSRTLSENFNEDLGLIVLEAAVITEPDVLARAAEILARDAAPAVVAQLWPLEADIATKCWSELYNSLMAEEVTVGDIGARVTAVRGDLLSSQKAAGVFSPVLFLRDSLSSDFEDRRTELSRRTSRMASTTLYLNGVDGETGELLVEPLSLADVAAIALPRRAAPTPVEWNQLVFKWINGPPVKKSMSTDTGGVRFGVDLNDVGQAGWAIVFGHDTPREVREALEPLIKHRRKSVPRECFQILEHKRGENHLEWLERHGISLGDVDPLLVPYYLLLVGGPTSIPFEVQYKLDLDYAVGRLAFDTADEYKHYVKSVIDYELAGVVPTKKEVIYWCPRYDGATVLSADSLVQPLFEGVEGQQPVAAMRGFEQRCLLGADATKSALVDVLHGHSASPPAMIFAASHGVGFRRDSPKQRAGQGALRCQDFTEGEWSFPASTLSAADVTNDAAIHGMVAFLFACFSAGTPERDDFVTEPSREARRLATAPFVAALPQRLLAHPSGGALAVIGHVERAWGYSIRPPNVGNQLLPFENAIHEILSGNPVGQATKAFSDRYASASAFLLSQMRETDTTRVLDEEQLIRRWIQRNDAQGYIILGDPAVRLRPDAMARG